MKKITLLILCVLISTISVTAKEKRDDSKYLTGAVTEVNGIVTFHKTFTVKGIQEDNLRKLVLGYIKTTLGGGGIEGNRTRLVSDGRDEDGLMVARIEEWMVFKKKFAYLDATRFRYTVLANVKGSTIDMTINQISYLYDEKIDDENKPTGEGGITYMAEEWITDNNALNKTKTKLRKGSGKFRRKTCDRVQQIYDKMMDFFEEEAAEEEAKAKAEEPVRPKRKFVTEE